MDTRTLIAVFALVALAAASAVCCIYLLSKPLKDLSEEVESRKQQLDEMQKRIKDLEGKDSPH